MANQSNRLRVFENQDQLGFLDYIWERFRRNKVPYTVVGAGLSCFEFDFNPHDFDNSCLHFNGRLYFAPNDRKPLPVTFLKIGCGSEANLRAENLFYRTNIIRHDGIINSWFFTFSKQEENLFVDDRIEMSGGLWVVCYDHFRCLLCDWLNDFATFQFKDPAKTTIKIKASGCLCTFWRENIRLLLEAIRSMHEVDSFHGTLNAKQSYAFSGKYDHLKILGIGQDLASHDEQSQASTKVADVRAFRTMLQDVLPTLLRSSGPLLWPEMTSFFSCFDKNDASYNTYMNRLIRHPFLMDPLGRFNYVIQLTSFSGKKRSDLHVLLSHGNFSHFAGWDVRLRTCDFLLELYQYPVVDPYVGSRAVDLLRFIRNSYHHFMHLKRCKNVTIGALDSAIRQYFPNFLDMIHSGL